MSITLPQESGVGGIGGTDWPNRRCCSWWQFLFSLSPCCRANWLEIRFALNWSPSSRQLRNMRICAMPPWGSATNHHQFCVHLHFLPPSNTRLGSLLNTSYKIQAIIEIVLLFTSSISRLSFSFSLLKLPIQWCWSFAAPAAKDQGGKCKSVSGTNLLWWHQCCLVCSWHDSCSSGQFIKCSEDWRKEDLQRTVAGLYYAKLQGPEVVANRWFPITNGQQWMIRIGTIIVLGIGSSWVVS